jgi:hypothetical protein
LGNNIQQDDDLQQETYMSSKVPMMENLGDTGEHGIRKCKKLESTKAYKITNTN